MSFFQTWFIFCCSVVAIYGSVLVRNFEDTAGSVDQTVVRGANGEEVVNACVDKLDHLNVFLNNYGFLNRIAKVETNFGTDYSNSNTSLGIWQIPSSTIPFLQANILDTAIAVPLSRIRSYYGEAFVDFDNFDLRIPFHSAIALRLYLTLSFKSTPFPGSVAEQGQWWSDNYHEGGDVMQFIITINNYETTRKCPSKEMDIWFLVDVSSSVGERHFQTALSFIRQLSRKFEISPSAIRTGLSTYSTDSTTISDLGQHHDNNAFEAAVNTTVYRRGRTFSGAAIDGVINNGFREANGARPYSERVPRILILLTDGYSSDSVLDPAADAESAGITTFAVGIGLQTKNEEINTIASYPSSVYAYLLNSYKDLTSILVDRFSTELCKVSVYVPLIASTQLSVPSNPSKFFSIRIATFTSTTISITGINGAGTVYLSTLPHPSSVLNLAAVSVSSGGQTSLTANSRQGKARSSSSTELSITGFDSSGYELPLFVSLNPQTSTGLTILFDVSASASTTTPSTVSEILVNSTEQSSLEWWAVLLIVLAALIGIVAFGFISLLMFGISRSSKYPQCKESCVSSLCACLVKSPAY